MKKLLLNICLWFFSSIGLLSAQDVRFSYEVDNHQGPTISVVKFYAEAVDEGGSPNCAGYTAVFYYNAGEATTASGNVDYSPTTNLGWLTSGNTTYSNNSDSNPNVPITFTNRIEIAVVDGNFAGTDFTSTPTLLLTITFNKDIGELEYGGEIYSGASSDTDDGIVYFDNNFGGWPIEYTGGREGVLPLDLISFDAKKYGERSSLLKWATANEINTSHFSIQRSTDKRTWYSAGEAKAAGNSQSVLNYNFVDENVYNGLDTRLTVYYRLQMVDLDGQLKNSPIKTVVFGSDAIAASFASSIYPNPASDGVFVDWSADNADQPTLIELYDVTGKLLLQHAVAPESNQEYIDFTPVKVQPGLYLIRMVNGTEILGHQQIVVAQSR